MKVNVTNILLGALVAVLFWQTLSRGDVNVEAPEVTVELPESSGSTGTKVIEHYVPYKLEDESTGVEYEVDLEWKEKYEAAKDSLEKQRVYLESIKINKYEKTFIDNDTIEIKGWATTRGSLLDFRIDHRIKTRTISYTPEVVYKRPKFSAGVEVEVGVPTLHSTNFLIKGDVFFENGKGNGFSLGYDNQERVWIGLRKTFKLIK